LKLERQEARFPSTSLLGWYLTSKLYLSLNLYPDPIAILGIVLAISRVPLKPELSSLLNSIVDFKFRSIIRDAFKKNFDFSFKKK